MSQLLDQAWNSNKITSFEQLLKLLFQLHIGFLHHQVALNFHMSLLIFNSMNATDYNQFELSVNEEITIFQNETSLSLWLLEPDLSLELRVSKVPFFRYFLLICCTTCWLSRLLCNRVLMCFENCSCSGRTHASLKTRNLNRKSFLFSPNVICWIREKSSELKSHTFWFCFDFILQT